MLHEHSLGSRRALQNRTSSSLLQAINHFGAVMAGLSGSCSLFLISTREQKWKRDAHTGGCASPSQLQAVLH